MNVRLSGDDIGFIWSGGEVEDGETDLEVEWCGGVML